VEADMKKLYILLGVLVIVGIIFYTMFYWKSEKQTQKEPEQELPTVKATFYKTDNPQYKKTGNPRFNFWFDLPVAWDAEDQSVNGDGYHIDSKNKRVNDIRIYGSYRTFSNEEYYDMVRDKTGTIIDFTFKDGSVGKIITKSTEHYFIRVETDRWITFYVNGPNDWYQQNQGQLIYIAKSMRPGNSE
jgi:hypothetical protein